MLRSAPGEVKARGFPCVLVSLRPGGSLHVNTTSASPRPRAVRRALVAAVFLVAVTVAGGIAGGRLSAVSDATNPGFKEYSDILATARAWYADDVPDDSVYVCVRCAACARVHLVNRQGRTLRPPTSPLVGNPT